MNVRNITLFNKQNEIGQEARCRAMERIVRMADNQTVMVISGAAKE